MSDLPNTNHPEHHTRAWLFPYEIRMLDALSCPDLTYSVEVSVLLAEDNDGSGRRKKGRAHAWNAKRTDEAESRETAASNLLPVLGDAVYRGASMLSSIANIRRNLHYARLGQDPPEVADAPTNQDTP